MQPLLERGVLAGVLDDLLGDDTTEEGGHRRDASARVGSSVVNDLLVEVFHVETPLALLSPLVDVLRVLNHLGHVCLPWQSTLLLLEVPDGSQRDMKLLGAPEESEIWRLQHTVLRGGSRVEQALGKAVVAHLLGHLHVLDQSLSLVGGETGRIHLHLEAETIDHIYLSGWQAIELSHAFDLVELDVVAILELVALILVDSDDAGVGLRGVDDDERLGVFAIRVIDVEVHAVVQESETMGTVRLREDESDFVFTTEIISLDHIINVC